MHINWQLFTVIFFAVNATIVTNYVFSFIRERKPKTNFNRLIMIVLFSSIVWSIGMGLMAIQESDKLANFWRFFGLFGTFVFMISVQMTLCILAKLPKKLHIVFNVFALSGIFVYIVFFLSGNTIFIHNNIGTTFTFQKGISTVLYSVYFTVVSINYVISTLYMLRREQPERIRFAGKIFLLIEILIFIGAIGDLIVPSMGLPAIPGSAITQCWGVITLWYAIHEMFKTYITVTNMSEYIYYSLGIPVLVFDSEKKLKLINDAASDYLSIESDTIVVEDVFVTDLFNADDELFSFSDKSMVREIENKQGVKCQLAMSKIEDRFGDLVGYITIVNDMSEHYRTIDRLEEAKRTADAANMAKSLFLANMSHEIRTPMNAILGFSEIALSEEVDEKAKEYFSDIKTAGTTLLAIINDILNITKIELGKDELNLSNYRPARIFNDVSLIVGVQAQKKKLAFEMKVDENVPDILYGDKDKIREVLVNLLNNAIKYTKSGGVVFEVNVFEKTANKVKLEYCVKDTGIGIKGEDLNSIFEVFKRADARANSQTEGTGLGLSITKGIVEQMGGSISVDSVYGVGSTFRVVLEQDLVHGEENETVEERNAVNSEKTVDFNNCKLLAVDDNKVNLKVISKLFDKRGIKYDLAASGQESIDLCKTNRYDLVFMDQMMPEMDGVEAMKKIRFLPGYEYHGESACRIVALTANEIEGVREKLLEEGFDDFLGKPIDMERFDEILRAYL